MNNFTEFNGFLSQYGINEKLLVSQISITYLGKVRNVLLILF